MNTKDHPTINFATVTLLDMAKTNTMTEAGNPVRPAVEIKHSLGKEIIKQKQAALLNEQVKPQQARSRRPNGNASQPSGQARLLQVPIDSLQVCADQSRRVIDPDTLQGLATSIKACGVLQPILVRPLAAIASGASAPDAIVYEIVAGERRWRASRDAGFTQMPVLVQTLDDAAAAEASLVENLQREDLTPLETAEALMRMMAQGYSVRRLAAQLGKQKGWVEQHLFLARLPEDLRTMVSGRPDTMTHAREIEKVTDLAVRADLITRVLDQDNPLSLAKLRQLIKETQVAKAAQDDVLPEQDDVLPELQSADGMGAHGMENAPSENELGENTHDGGAAETSALSAILEKALSEEALTSEEASLLELEASPESEVSTESEAEPVDTASDNVLYQEGLLANLRTTQKRLPRLPVPTDPVRRQELVTMLTATRDAIALTLVRWEVQKTSCKL